MHVTITIWGGVLLPSAEASSGPSGQHIYVFINVIKQATMSHSDVRVTQVALHMRVVHRRQLDIARHIHDGTTATTSAALRVERHSSYLCCGICACECRVRTARYMWKNLGQFGLKICRHLLPSVYAS